MELDSRKRMHLLEKALNYTRVGIIVTDPSIEDNPIVIANKGFLELTGYEEHEIIGKNCRFLQGKDTDNISIKQLRDAIQNKEPITIQIYNYKKDGTGFWNELSIDHMWDEQEGKYFFVGVQKDITNEKQNELLYEKSLKEIEKISTPIVPIMKDVSILPLIGTMNDTRIEALITSLSDYLENSDQHYLIIDLSGLFEMDTYTVSRFLKIHQFVSMMGKDLLVAGIRPDMAMKTLTIQDTWQGMRTFKDVKMAVEYIKQKEPEIN
ncbi:protein kinase [Oceanobacillus iheyensis HTE831]|uniref:Protein kinase n=1 Tax=Oceanobacillus iheyensis (strain DSM 14371 / CIP 107618 / JCM 11309 / KCTC 3954 / HTE831) TaxID=221109 RepID=Q8ESN8_OCEIH|nr:PAS domain-containing protein [Oceanobacillus iheyensis]BAC12544.1 protein kinase [Oceanobacillus iheyensis HTE831]